MDPLYEPNFGHIYHFAETWWLRLIFIVVPPLSLQRQEPLLFLDKSPEGVINVGLVNPCEYCSKILQVQK